MPRKILALFSVAVILFLCNLLRITENVPFLTQRGKDAKKVSISNPFRLGVFASENKSHSSGQNCCTQSDWMDKVVKREFRAFEKNGISQELIDATWKNCKDRKEFKRFKIIDSVVYGDDCKIKRFLQKLVQVHSIPNVDFIYFNEDRIKPSFFKRSANRTCAPILVSAKNKSMDQVILFSDWMYDATDAKEGWNDLIRMINGLQAISWEEREEKLFWRGKPWDGKHFGMYDFGNWKEIPRGRLVSESQKHPDLIDAAFSEYPEKCLQQDLDRCVLEMGKIQYVSWEKALHYKYQMAIDGVTCSFPATQWKLLSGALTLKQDSPDIMYFYDELIPWVHYVPVRNDLSDLIEKIRWAKTHDEEARKIAEEGRRFALEHLMPEHIFQYASKILCKYADLQKFSPRADDELP